MSTRELAQRIRDALGSDPVPVPLRAVIAGTLMCAQGGAPTRLGMANVASYSYGSSQNHYSDLLDRLVEALPRVVAGMAVDDIDPLAMARARDGLRRRDQTIADLRAEIVSLKDRHEDIKRYALSADTRARELEAQMAAQSGKKVRALRPLPAPVRQETVKPSDEPSPPNNT
ncbi:MAG: hypothetical protein ABWX92_08475 [Mycetocola sp.]